MVSGFDYDFEKLYEMVTKSGDLLTNNDDDDDSSSRGGPKFVLQKEKLREFVEDGPAAFTVGGGGGFITGYVLETSTLASDATATATAVLPSPPFRQLIQGPILDISAFFRRTDEPIVLCLTRVGGGTGTNQHKKDYLLCRPKQILPIVQFPPSDVRILSTDPIAKFRTEIVRLVSEFHQKNNNNHHDDDNSNTDNDDDDDGYYDVNDDETIEGQTVEDENAKDLMDLHEFSELSTFVDDIMVDTIEQDLFHGPIDAVEVQQA